MTGSLTIGAVCDEEPPTVCASTSLRAALQAVLTSSADAAVVIASAVKNPTAIGIITWRDLVRALASGIDLERATVLDMLDPVPLVLHEQDGVDRALAQLRYRGMTQAPVIGAAGTLRGLITLDRLLTCRALSVLC